MSEIRRATLADLQACLAVQRASTVVGYAHIFDQALYPFPEESVRQEWRARLAGDERRVFLAADAGRPAGTVATGEGELSALFVVPEHWGSGLASRLHAAALADARERGWREIRLRVLKDNPRARRFYEREGWRVTGDAGRLPFPPEPALVAYRLPIA